MLDPQVKEIRRGDAIYADWLNEIADLALKRLTGANGVTVREDGKRFVIEIDPSQIIPK